MLQQAFPKRGTCAAYRTPGGRQQPLQVDAKAGMPGHAPASTNKRSTFCRHVRALNTRTNVQALPCVKNKLKQICSNVRSHK